MNIEERFWAKVRKTDTCWLWTAGQQGAGYGSFRIGTRADGYLVLAHRFSYESCVGPIPDGLVLDHLCRVRNCVNPDHLEPVTRGENTRRGETVLARNLRKTHCPKGHPYDAENTHVSNGKRRCLTCRRAHDAGRPRHGRRDAVMRPATAVQAREAAA